LKKGEKKKRGKGFEESGWEKKRGVKEKETRASGGGIPRLKSFSKSAWRWEGASKSQNKMWGWEGVRKSRHLGYQRGRSSRRENTKGREKVFQGEEKGQTRRVRTRKEVGGWDREASGTAPVH